MDIRNLACIFCFLVVFHTALSMSKYDKKMNDVVQNDFRMNRVNALWKKARKMIHNQEKLRNLKLELGKLDKLELELKHMKDDGKDADGVVEGEVRRRLIDILERYGLIPIASDENTIEHHSAKKLFVDQRLKKLWEQATYHADFTPEELIKLQEELTHHEDKVSQYDALAEELSQHEAITENHVEHFEKPSEQELKRMKLELKEQLHDVSGGIAELKKKIQGRLDGLKAEFSDPRILDLWKTAKRNNFTREELESIKEELTHFQQRINKHDYWNEQKAILQNSMESGDVHAGKRHEEALKKLEEHGRYIKKYHATMLDRVSKRDEF